MFQGKDKAPGRGDSAAENPASPRLWKALSTQGRLQGKHKRTHGLQIPKYGVKDAELAKIYKIFDQALELKSLYLLGPINLQTFVFVILM